MKTSRCSSRALLAAFILSPFLEVSAQAATLTVNSAADAGGTCPGATCTLRQAIATAVSGDTIDFAAGLSVITLTSAELLINKNLTLNGPGANQLSVQCSPAPGKPGFRVFNILASTVTISGLTISKGEGNGIQSNGVLTIANSTISGNSTSTSGGGISNNGGTLTITNSNISGNSAKGFSDSFGGGVQNEGTLTITDSTISGNSSTNEGGGIRHDSGTLTIINSTISGNSSTSGGGGGINGVMGTITISNSTISGNSADDDGGGISTQTTLTITNSTFTANSAASHGGGVFHEGAASFIATNTIIALNTASTGPDVYPSLDSHGYNFIGDNSDATIAPTTGDQIGTKAQPKNPMLGPLQDNGGPTKTRALLSGSTAIEGGNSSGFNTDERGFARPVDSPSIANVGDGSDIGAYEVQADVLPGCSSINRVVKNANDSGADSLRGVIANVCAGSVITFAPNVTGSIDLTSAELLVNKSLTITGPGANLLSVQRSAAAGTPDFRIFNIASNLNATISGLTIARGNASSSFGGGISNNATLTLANDTISGNSAAFGGGGVANAGPLTLTNCAILANSGGSGGSGIANNSTLTISGSTIAGNSADGGNGGGISNNGTTTLRNSTIAGNAASGAGGGVHNFSGTVTVTNTIIGLNTAPSAPDFNGALTSQGFNLIGNSSGATISPAQFTDQIGTAGSPLDPLLGSLQDNGGPTFTRALLPGSPAIDKGDSGGLTTDQRGFPRPIDLGSIANANGGDGSDIGAFEMQATPILTPGNSPSVALGEAIADVATLSGGSSPTGTMTFQLFGPNDGTCSGAPIKTFPLNVHGNATYITGPFTPPAPGAYNWVVTYSGDAANVGLSSICGAPNQSFTVTQTVLGNISTRLRVETGDNALIAGFIITGTQPKKVIVRGIGTSLPFPDRLADPTLELRDSTGALIDSNDNWGDSPNKQAIIDSTIPPSNDLESAIIATLPANNSSYTAIVRGVNNGTGIGVVEAYDLDTSANSKLANISTRGFVSTGDNVLIAGTIVVGLTSQKVIVEALGPSLTVPGNLADPTLEVRDASGTVLDANDNWVDSANKQAIIDSTIPPTNDLESAVVVTLPAGGAQYTAIVRGVNGTTGVAVVEVFALQ
jgi:hypothetical protein